LSVKKGERGKHQGDERENKSDIRGSRDKSSRGGPAHRHKITSVAARLVQGHLMCEWALKEVRHKSVGHVREGCRTWREVH